MSSVHMSAAFALQFWPQLLSSIAASILVAFLFWLIGLPSRRVRKMLDEASKKASDAEERAKSVSTDTYSLIARLQEERRIDNERIKTLDTCYNESVALTNHLIAQIADLNSQVEELKQANNVSQEIIAGLRQQVKQLQDDKNRLLREKKAAAKNSEMDCEGRLKAMATQLQAEIDGLAAQVNAAKYGVSKTD